MAHQERRAEQARKAGADVVGVDPSPSMVKRASRRVPDATVVEGYAESLPFLNDEFTHVWAISTFHHWASPEAGINEVRRVLAPGGRFLVMERKLKAGKSGHGFDSDKAQELSTEIEALGLRDCMVDTMRAKRAEYLVVSGRL